jgi:hypothetical protein
LQVLFEELSFPFKSATEMGFDCAAEEVGGMRRPEESVIAFLLSSFALGLVLSIPSLAHAHGFAGKRFFPTTFQVDDPFVSDEFSILLDHIKEPAGRSTEIDVELSKRLTSDFGLTAGDSFLHREFSGGGSANGLGNFEIGAKYQFLTDEPHETILSIGTSAEIGGTGARRVGAESFSTVSPALFFGKGFGDLPEKGNYLKPFAVTGVIAPNFPTRRTSSTVDPETGESETERNPTTLSWSFSLQYSLIYLQSFVKDVGLDAPFNRMVLIVEFPMETCLSSGCDGETTGTVNPGLVWAGKKMELGLAAQIPVNSRTGNSVGVLALFHLFIDDLFPKSIGRPLFQ